MTNFELKQLRKLLFLEVAEAAEHVAQVKPRAWQRWEDGSRKIPADVIGTITLLAIARAELLAAGSSSDDPAYLYFDDIDDHANALGERSVIKWRLAQSIATQMTYEHISRVILRMD